MREQTSDPSELEETEGLHIFHNQVLRRAKEKHKLTQGEMRGADNWDLIPYLKLQSLILTPNCTTHPEPHHESGRGKK